MTDTLRELERSHEAKYKLDEELHFKARCRRNKVFGHWAARHLGLIHGSADAYARELVRLELDPRSRHMVADKVISDLREAGAKLDAEDVHRRFELSYVDALDQLAKEYPRALDRDHVAIGG